MSFGSRYLDPPTLPERERIAALKRLGCAACNRMGLRVPEHCGPIEYHHRTSAGFTLSQRQGFALGRWHHQGIAKPGRSLDSMREKYGPNLRDDKGGFHATFGTDQQLQNDQDDAAGYPREDMPTRRDLRERGGQPQRKPSRCARPLKMLPPRGIA